MKIRDRQEKVERVLSLYSSSKGNPFQDARTLVRGEVDIVGGLLLLDSINDQHRDAIQTAGVTTGIDFRFLFETTNRQKDRFVAEFVADGKGEANFSAGALSLAKVMYAANVSDWLSAVVVPLGAQCKDVAVKTSLHQDKSLTEYSSFGPPILNQYHGGALGVSVITSNIAASCAQFVSGPRLYSNSSGLFRWFSTFGQIVFQLSSNTKLSVLGLHKMPNSSNRMASLGGSLIPIGALKLRKRMDVSVEEDQLPLDNCKNENLSDRSVALMLESGLDSSTRIGCWVEVKQSHERYLQWAINFSDTPQDDIGWGLSVGGLVQSPRCWDNFQVEGHLNFSIGNRFRLKPSVVYMNEGNSHIPALLLRSSWSL